MPYTKSSRLPSEKASKLGHLHVIKSEWVSSLIKDFESTSDPETEINNINWRSFNISTAEPLKSVWATDGSFVPIKSSTNPAKELAFVKTALFLIDKTRLKKIDKENPHPLLMQDIMKKSAIFHATVFPLKNIQTSLGTNYDTIRHIIFDSMRIDEKGAFFETLKWLVYRKWNKTNPTNSPSFHCPHCGREIKGGFNFDMDTMKCPLSSCGKDLFLTDMIGFHLEMNEDNAPTSLVSAYMLIMEHLMLFTAIRVLWDFSDKKQVSNTLFIKDGPLTLNKQYSKLVPCIRDFLQFAKENMRPLHIVGQEKTGAFVDHLNLIARFTKPYSNKDRLSFSVLTHDYIRKEVQRRPHLQNAYGSRTNWGEKVFVKIDPSTSFALSIPTGNYVGSIETELSETLPNSKNIIGLSRILATLPSLISKQYDNAIFPIEVVNGIASMSSYPSAKILEQFSDSNTN